MQDWWCKKQGNKVQYEVWQDPTTHSPEFANKEAYLQM